MKWLYYIPHETAEEASTWGDIYLVPEKHPKGMPSISVEVITLDLALNDSSSSKETEALEKVMAGKHCYVDVDNRSVIYRSPHITVEILQDAASHYLSHMLDDFTNPIHLEEGSLDLFFRNKNAHSSHLCDILDQDLDFSKARNHRVVMREFEFISKVTDRISDSEKKMEVWRELQRFLSQEDGVEVLLTHLKKFSV